MRELHITTLIDAIADQSSNRIGFVEDTFGDELRFEALLAHIAALDKSYGEPKQHRDLFDPIACRGDNLATVFNQGCIDGWQRLNRPSLPALARTMLTRLGLNEDKLVDGNSFTQTEVMLGRSIMMTALRAEMIHGDTPSESAMLRENPFHNSIHTGMVASIAYYLVHVNNHLRASEKIVTLSREDHLMVTLAAFAHDIDHPGTSNPRGEHFRNEDQSFAAVEPILTYYNVDGLLQDDIHTLLQATSPDGGSACVRSAAAKARAGGPKDNERQDLVMMAAILIDADLHASAGAGREANRIMGERLARELRIRGIHSNVTSDRQVAAFLNTHLRDGFASPAARTAFAGQIESLRQAVTPSAPIFPIPVTPRSF